MAYQAPIGNEFWKLRSKHGRDKLFKTPELLWDAACEYFKWCDENPLKEQRLFAFQGIVTKEDANKMRPYTLIGLCLYLDCSSNYFRAFAANNKDARDFITIITRIEDTIYTQKFAGAAADLLNANIIARDLGLKDSKEITGEIVTSTLTKEERALKLKQLKKKL